MCVTRRWKPNCVSAATCSARTSSGKATLRNFSVSFQSVCCEISRRRAPGASESLLSHGRVRRDLALDDDPRHALVVDRRREGGDVAQVGDPVAVVAVDVPRVPPVRDVLVRLEEVALAARRDGVASGREVDGRGEEPLGRDGHGDDAVVEHPAAVALDQRHGIRPGALCLERRDAAGRHPGTLEGRRVGLDHDVTLTDERRERPRDDRLGRLGDPGVLLDRLAVHPRDRRAREDVVELLEQHLLPQRVELVVGVCRPRPHRGRGRPQAPPRRAGARCDGCPASSGAATSASRGAGSR